MNNNLFIEEILNLLDEGIIVTNNLYEIIFVNNKSKDDIQSINKSKDIIGLPITSIFKELAIIGDNMTNKIFRNKKITLTVKKIIQGDLLYSSLSDIDSDIIFEIKINTIIHDDNIYHLFILHENINENINYKNETISYDNIKKKQNNFVAFLSHELRNPLQSIILSNYLLKKEIQKIDCNQKINSYLTTMEKSANDMKKIINDILDLSKIEARELSIDISPCSITNIIDELLLINSNDISINVEYVNAPEILYTDDVRLSQILTNLLTNAIKYTMDESQKIINIIIKYNENTNYIEFNIIDYGIGIRDDEINHIFNEYSKTTNNIKINCNSNGLGLCISQKMAKLLGGYISVKSEYQKGSIFTLHHPINLQNKINNKNIINENIKTINNITGKILLVDDNGSNVSLLKMLMEQLNCDMNYNLEIHTVNSGHDSIKICQINNYNLIFMDINMTGMDGCTASKMIKKEGYTNAIIATTGNIMAKQKELSEKYSCFDDILIKPFDSNIVLDMIHKYIN
jgi:hypothetical protein